MILSQLEAFGLTLATEAAAAALLAPVFAAPRGKAALAACVGSSITHPIVWRGAFVLYPSLGHAAIPLLEAVAIAVESAFYRGLASLQWTRAVLLSAVVNGISWGLGALIQGAL